VHTKHLVYIASVLLRTYAGRR